jgi:hypothetical protein
MFANLGLLYRKAGMSRSAFMQRYEHGHVPLIKETIGSSFGGYGRCYPLVADDQNAGFDALTQIWYANAADAERSITLLSDPEIGQRIAEDEKALFDRARLFFFKVDEFTDGLPPSTEGQIKAVCLSQPVQGDRDTFIRSMEHVMLPVFAALGAPEGRYGLQGSRRGYAIPGSAFQHNLYAAHTRQPPGVVTETWFADRGCFDRWRDAYPKGDEALIRAFGEPIEVRQFGDRGPAGSP